MNQIFVKLDALITPTAPMAALALDAPEADFDRAREFTLPFSVGGLPAISVPCGFDRGGLPLGMQIVGARGGESMVLRIAAAYEAARR
jgi:aspartyl-tRNA(Asn)/glutamyl-tRNA(Gln) amidotransferase subunit A